MNIFYLDDDPIEAARLHCIRHTKMILESAQILSTCVRIQFPDANVYKPTHKNHPCVKWVTEGRDNFIWLCDMSLHLCSLYRKRHNGIAHKSELIINIAKKHLPYLKFVYTNQTMAKQAMPDEYKNKNSVKAYLDYYINEKSKLFTEKDGNLLSILKEKFNDIQENT